MISKELLSKIPNKPSIGLIVGGPGSGKSVMGYGLLEEISKQYGRRAFVYGFPEGKSSLLPPFITLATALGDLGQDSVALLDESYIKFYSRNSMSNENKAADVLAGLVRQYKMMLIFITQQSRKLDIGIVSSVHWIAVKKPSLLQMEFERPQIKKMMSKVYSSIDSLDNLPRPAKVDLLRAGSEIPPLEDIEDPKFDDRFSQRCTYLLSDHYKGLMINTNTAPEWWTEDISEAFSQVKPDEEEDEEGSTEEKDLRISPDYFPVLRNLVEYEEELAKDPKSVEYARTRLEDPGADVLWAWDEVEGMTPQLCVELVKKGLVQVLASSRLAKEYRLRDREKVKSLLGQ